MLAFALVVQRGIVAVAEAFTTVSFVMAPLWLFGVHKLVRLDAKRYIGQIAAPLASSAVMMVSVYGLKLATTRIDLVWQVTLLVTVGVATYSGVLYFLGRPLAQEALELVRLAIPRRDPQDGTTS